MKCQAAILHGTGQDWSIAEITLDPPREGEVLVKMAVAGICHSDDHYATGDAIMSPELAAMVEAGGGTVPDVLPTARRPRRRRRGGRCWRRGAVGTAR